MKALHRPDLFCWSRFDEERDVDFHSVAWIRPGGNVVFDPLPRSAHDEQHLRRLGGVQWIALTNAHHVRDALAVARTFGAKIAAPAKERDLIQLSVERWLSDGDELVSGLRTVAFEGSKTPGELAFVLEETTLVTGDLIRSHCAGTLHWLPDAKLENPAAARRSARRLLDFPRIDSVLVGDGWHLVRYAGPELRRLLGAG